MTSFENQDTMKNMIFPINTTTRFFSKVLVLQCTYSRSYQEKKSDFSVY